MFGKPIGGDIVNNKKTWLLTRAYELCGKSDERKAALEKAAAARHARAQLREDIKSGATSVEEVLNSDDPIAQRLKVAKLLRSKTSYSAINKETGVSSATISRVSRCLDYGTGGYQLVLERLEKRG